MKKLCEKFLEVSESNEHVADKKSGLKQSGERVSLPAKMRCDLVILAISTAEGACE
jgi:hypothetical protein